jgi:hypothetical protein
MIFCNNERFDRSGPDGPDPESTKYFYDFSMKKAPFISSEFTDDDSKRPRCHSVTYNAQRPEGDYQAITTPSDRLDKKAYVAAPRPKRPIDYSRPRTDIAFSIDVCRWFIHKMFHQGWPRVDKDRITLTQQPGFRGGITWHATPIDGLRTMGLTMLHEVKRSTPILSKSG